MTYSKKYTHLTASFVLATSLAGCAGMTSSTPTKIVDPMDGIYGLKVDADACIVELKANSSENLNAQTLKQMHLSSKPESIDMHMGFDYTKETISLKVTSAKSPYKTYMPKITDTFAEALAGDQNAQELVMKASKYLPATCFKKGSPYSR